MLLALATQAANINGILLDANDTTALIGASVRLLKPTKDSTLVKGTATDDNGLFDLKGVKAGKYLLKLSYVGYKDEVKHITVGSDGRNVNLGAIKMQPNSIMLKEAVVMGVKTPITVKEDTIEYNADTYKTQPNAVVEDLLKRMPGVEVDANGKITANGKEVKKILIDGKEFFADDPKMASKNLPADMINKLQVIDRKSDLARLTGVDDGEDETVINLTVKPGMNNGWVGSITGGYGTNNRYSGNLMLNYFKEGNQYTITGGGNNINSLNFTDGGASRFQRLAAATASPRRKTSASTSTWALKKTSTSAWAATCSTRTATATPTRAATASICLPTAPATTTASRVRATRATTCAATSASSGKSTRSTHSRFAPTSRSTSARARKATRR